MALSDSRLAYEDVFKVLDRAIEAPNGIRIKFAKRGDALRFRMRINYGRNLDRKTNRENFEIGHPMFGRSLYDGITVQDPVRDGPNYWLYIKQLSGESLEIEELSDEHQAPNGDYGTAEGEGEASRGGEEAPSESSEAVRRAAQSLIRRI